MSFLTAGADAGEPGLFFGYHETPRALIQKAEAVGLPLRRRIEEGRIHLYWKAPTELLADEEAQRLQDLVERHEIRRVVVDALEDVRQSVIPRDRELDFLSGFTNRLRQLKVSTLLMQDLERIVGLNIDLPMAELSAMLDNIIHLRYVEQKGELKRLVSVLKVRAREHDHRLRELQISATGSRWERRTTTPTWCSPGWVSPAEDPGVSRAPRVLVADDEPAITILVAHMLEHAGIEVLRAHGGVHALTLARAERPDLILLDVMMPDLDGRDTCRALKMDEELRTVPVVLFSSAGEDDVHWRAAGADAFLQKPVDIRSLPTLVRERVAPRS